MLYTLNIYNFVNDASIKLCLLHKTFKLPMPQFVRLQNGVILFLLEDGGSSFSSVQSVFPLPSPRAVMPSEQHHLGPSIHSANK